MTLYCICRRKEDDRFMIGCEACDEWFHGDCVSVTKAEAKTIDHWFCTSCVQKRARDSLAAENSTLMKANYHLMEEITHKEAEKRDLLIEINALRRCQIEVLHGENEDLKKQKTLMMSPTRKDAFTMTDFPTSLMVSPTMIDASTMVDFPTSGLKTSDVSMFTSAGSAVFSNDKQIAQDFKEEENINSSTIFSSSQQDSKQDKKPRKHSRLSLKGRKNYFSQQS